MRSEIPLKIVAWLFIAWVAFLARRAPAQEISPDSGAKVRVRPAAEPGMLYEGRLLSLTRDSVVLAVPGSGAMRWSRRAVARLEVGRRGSRAANTFAGMGIGLVVGAAVGAGVGSAASRPDDFFGPEFAVAMGALLFGTTGTVAGGIVGYNRPHTRWDEMPLSVGITGRGLGVSFAF